MTIIGDAFVEIKPDSHNFAKSAESGVTSQMKDVAKIAAGTFAATFAAEKIFDFGKGAVEAADEARKIAAQTAAVIKSTQGVANVSSEEVEKLARSLAHISGVEDDTIQKAENLLLTFKNIRNGVGEGNDIFDQTTKVLLDMSKALGKDAPSAAIQLGKALNDPTKGLLALTRVGVSFTTEQKNQIKALQASGDLLGAQKLIIAELNSEFGGSAAAQATAAAKFKETIHEIQEDLGAKLLPVIDGIANGLSVVIPAAIDDLGAALRPAEAIFSPIIRGGENLLKTIFDPSKGVFGKSRWQLGLDVIGQQIDNFLLGRGTNQNATAAAVAKNFGIPEVKVQGPASPAQGGLVGRTLGDVTHDQTLLAIADQNASELDKITAKVGQTISNFFHLGIDVHVSRINQDLATGFDVIKNDFLAGSVEVSDFLATHGGAGFGQFVLNVGNATNTALQTAGPLVVEGFHALTRDIGVEIGNVQTVLKGIAGVFSAVDSFIGDSPGELFRHIGAGIERGALDLESGIVKANSAVFQVGVTVVNGIVNGILHAGEDITKAILGFLPSPGDVVKSFVGGAVGLGKKVLNFFGATGGTVTSGGFLVVGEHGPEIVRLPTGSQIFSNGFGNVRPGSVPAPAPAALAAAGSTFHVEQMIVPAPPDTSPLEVASTIAEHFAWRFGMRGAA